MTAPVDFTPDGLRKMHACAVFLGSPADSVVRQCISEIERLQAALAAIEPAAETRITKLRREALEAAEAEIASVEETLRGVDAVLGVEPAPAQGAGEDRRDAERYRWLRAGHLCEKRLREVIHDDCNPPYDGFKCESALDRAIDAAIASTKEPK